jgi:hypothetical protein
MYLTSSYDTTTYRGAFSGSSVYQSPAISGDGVDADPLQSLLLTYHPIAHQSASQALLSVS